jgi:L-threonylcarbamoyladenylate synthase
LKGSFGFPFFMVTRTGIDIQLAREMLEAGKTVAIPTETVYGLAANALNINAVVRIFDQKQRPSFDPLIVHIHQIGDLEKYAHVHDQRVFLLAEKFWPGPLTIVLPKRENIPDIVTSGLPTVALRIPRHELTLQLLKTLNFPLAAPSANLFGHTSPTSVAHVLDQLDGKVSYVLDGGETQIGLESTIVKFSSFGTEVLRLGGLTLEELEETLSERIKTVRSSSSNPEAPGMLSAHYNPGIPIEIGDPNKTLKLIKNKKVGVLAFGQESFDENVAVFNLSKSKNIEEAARNLFKGLRYFRKARVDIILADWLPEEGLGRAVNDRLRRAAVSNHI